MKKTNLLLSAFALLALSGCGGGESSPVSLYEEDSMLVVTSYGEEGYELPTYRHKDYGEVPFVDLDSFLAFFDSDVSSMKVSKIADHVYAVSFEGVIAMLLDAKANTITVKRFDYLLRSFTGINNGIAMDPCSPNTVAGSLVHPSYKSKVNKTYVDEVYNLNDYHMDIVEVGDKVILPFQFISNLMMRTLGVDVIYNGHDYFLSSLKGFAQAGCYTGNDTFRYNDWLHERLENAPAGEFRRYVAKDPSILEGDPRYSIFALTNDGKGFYWNEAGSETEAIPEQPAAKLVWEKEGEDIIIGAFSWNSSKKEYAAKPTSFRIRHDQTLFNAKKRSQTLANYNYDILRFQFDRLYGLKKELNEKQGYTDFDSFVASKGLKESLLSTDSGVYDDALATFTMKYVDDGHTNYTTRSLISGMVEKNAEELAKEHPGSRRSGLFDKLHAYQAKRTEALGGEEPLGVFMEGETAVIRFDMFVHLASYVNALPEGMDEFPLSMIMGVSSPWGFMMSFDQIKANPDIKNVVLDLTCNSGGMVLTLPYLAAHFTKDPIFLGHDTLMGVDNEFHYTVDLNGNGVFGEDEDTYANKYNFYVLTSDFSFSCGSALPTMAHMAGVKLIGKRSGGGACPVAAFADACGSVYNTSSPVQIGYYDNNGQFVNDDSGIPVDYALSEDSWYDLEKLNTFVSGLKNA